MWRAAALMLGVSLSFVVGPRVGRVAGNQEPNAQERDAARQDRERRIKIAAFELDLYAENYSASIESDFADRLTAISGILDLSEDRTRRLEAAGRADYERLKSQIRDLSRRLRLSIDDGAALSKVEEEIEQIQGVNVFSDEMLLVKLLRGSANAEQIAAFETLRGFFLAGGWVQLEIPLVDRWQVGLEQPNNKFGDEDLERLCRLKSIRGLTFRGSKLTATGLAHLKNLPDLWELKLSLITLTPGDVHQIAELKNLASLELSECRIDDDAAATLERMDQLERLSLAQNDVTDATAVRLKGLKQLQRLSLTNTLVTDRGLESIAELTELRSLSLNNTLLTDEGMPLLTRLPNLTRIDIGRTDVTDLGLQSLHGMRQLKVVGLGGAPVSGDGIKLLRARLSKVHVTPAP